MILSCDPPRHAFLIHFGKRQQPSSLETRDVGYHVQIALSPESAPPSLVGIHFVRHGFRLPFVLASGGFSTDHFSLQSGSRDSRYFFYFLFEPDDCQEWKVAPGLTLLISGNRLPRSDDFLDAGDRPVLHGLHVDLRVLGVDVDMSEFVFEFGADYLKDVSVDLFVQKGRS